MQLVTTLRDHALTWYMKYDVQQNKTLDVIRTTLIANFKKPKSKSQCIMELKEIKHKPLETIWDFDQRFKVLMSQLSFEIPDAQHKEWFIAMLTPHIIMSLMQQKILTQSKALEIAMKLEATPVGEASIGMAQIQTQLANLTIHIQDMKKGKGT